MDIDLDKLTKEDFIEMAKYCAHLESEIEKYKSAALMYYTQRNNAEFKLAGKKFEVKETTIDIEAEQL
jgi:hypothetical protein